MRFQQSFLSAQRNKQNVCNDKWKADILNICMQDKLTILMQLKVLFDEFVFMAPDEFNL